jgi:hypothetical protein
MIAWSDNVLASEGVVIFTMTLKPFYISFLFPFYNFWPSSNAKTLINTIQRKVETLIL